MDNVREAEFSHHYHNQGSRPQLPVLEEYRSIRDQLHGRLCREVDELECRIQVLRASRSRHSQSIISTYERMIQQKRRFMAQWGMGADTRALSPRADNTPEAAVPRSSSLVANSGR